MNRNKKNKVSVFESVDLLNNAAAELIINISEKAIKERGRFSFCLSGGNTPKKLYSLLATAPFNNKIDWKNTFVFWSDERCVPLDDERNNAHMAETTLLEKVKPPIQNIFPMPVQLPPAEAAKKYEETLHHFFGNQEPRFDVMLLGLGDNGHTASLFPGTPVLNEKTSWVKEVVVADNVAGATHRITFTASLINEARHILFLVAGEEKSQVLETVLNGAYLPERYPAQLIDPANGEVVWYVDDKAATHLKNGTNNA